eukprot:3234708-Amphidinium_carterae.1
MSGKGLLSTRSHSFKAVVRLWKPPAHGIHSTELCGAQYDYMMFATSNNSSHYHKCADRPYSTAGKRAHLAIDALAKR